MLGGKSLVQGTNYYFSHLLRRVNLDVVHMEDHNRYDVTSNHRTKHAGISQALLEITLH